MNRQEKAEKVSEIRDLLDGAQLVVLTEYAGLDVSQMVTLRRNLRATGADLRVMKNTLAKLATAETDLDGLHPHFEGPVGVVFTKEDAAATAKALVAFQKDNPKLEIKAGSLAGGQLLDAEGLVSLSKLPSRDQLRSQLIAVLQGVPRKLVGIFAAVPRDFVGVLNARRRELAGE